MNGLEQVPLLISAVGAALLLVLEQLIPDVERRWQEVARHGAQNIGVGVLNGTVLALLAAPLLTGVSIWIDRTEIGLVRTFGEPWRTGIGLVLFDGWMYLWHRANHRIGLLWRFHRLHHLDAAMDVTTTFRFHPGEIALSTAARLVIMPLLGLTVQQLLFYELVMFPIILFHHSNLRLSKRVDWLLRWLIVTPTVHRVHHSWVKIETESNFGSVLTVWDRLAGTIRSLPDGTRVRFGLSEEKPPAIG